MRQASKNEEEQFLAFERKRRSELELEKDEENEDSDEENEELDQDLSELASIRHYFSFSRNEDLEVSS